MEFLETSINGVKLIKPTIFEDIRGFFIETYHEELYESHGIAAKFVQDDLSISYKHILRGIHGDKETWKLVSCIYGKIYSVVVDCDEDSSEFGKWEAFDLSQYNKHQVLVPPKFGLSYLVLSNIAIFHYKQSAYYSGADKQFTYRYDDPRFGIWWPIKNPILSERDEKLS